LIRRISWQRKTCKKFFRKEGEKKERRSELHIQKERVYQKREKRKKKKKSTPVKKGKGKTTI